MHPTLFINIENIHLSGGALAGVSTFTDGFIPEAPGEFNDWEKRIWRRGYEAAHGGSAPAGETLEKRELGGGERVTQQQMQEELAAMGADWRLETPAELFGHVDYGHKNQHGAYSRDESLKDSYYWTNQETPWYEGGRVVVGFSYGYVLSNFADLRAFARAVRVAGQ